MNRPAIIPPLTMEDRLPHDRAVWREASGLAPMGEPPSRQISVEYRGGAIEQTTVALAHWPAVVRYRFGWSPSQ